MTQSLWFMILGAVTVVLAIPLLLRRIPPNPIYGLRLPATFKDEQVWYDANAACGRDLALFGAAITLLAALLPAARRPRHGVRDRLGRGRGRGVARGDRARLDARQPDAARAASRAPLKGH